jgi:hypothetical protein
MGKEMSTTDDKRGWVIDLYRDVDAMDRNRIGRWLSADDYETRFGNRPPVIGKENALASSARFWTTISAMRHEIHEILVDGNRAVSIATVTYTRLDGSEVSMPVSTFIRWSGERKIDRLWIYADITPLTQ